MFVIPPDLSLFSMSLFITSAVVVPLRTLCGGASFSTDIPVWTNVCQHPVLKYFP